MSFSEDCVRFGDRLAKLVDAGVPVKDVAVSLGISRQRCYAILRATGRPLGSPRTASRDADTTVVVEVFTATRSITQAAKSVGVSHGVARRLLVGAGLVSEDRQPYGKAAARARFLALLGSGWSNVWPLPDLWGAGGRPGNEPARHHHQSRHALRNRPVPAGG